MNITENLDGLQNARPCKLDRDTAGTCVYKDHNVLIRFIFVTNGYVYVAEKLFQVV